METVVKKPIKRDPNLVALSREHHFGLLFAWKLKQGLAKKVSLEILRKYVLYFWDKNLRKHLLAEEELLLYVLPENDTLQIQFLHEHELIRDLVQQIENREQLSELLIEALQILINDHIRFEERNFFPHLEQHCSPQKLEEIGKHLAEEHTEPDDDFQPEFWVTPKK